MRSDDLRLDRSRKAKELFLVASHRLLIPVLLVAFAVSTMATVVRARSLRDISPTVAQAETAMVASINSLRVGRGVGPLVVDPELIRVSDAWTQKMMQNGTIGHNPNLAEQVRGDWRRLGENVGSGGDPTAVMTGFIKSPEHLRNLLDPTFDTVAVTMREVDGEWYVTQQFADVATNGHLGPDDPSIPDLLQQALPPAASPEA